MNIDTYKQRILHFHEEAITIRNSIPATLLRKSGDLEEKISSQMKALDIMREEVAKNRHLTERQIKILTGEINRLHSLFEASATNVISLSSGDLTAKYPVEIERLKELDEVTRTIGIMYEQTDQYTSAIAKSVARLKEKESQILLSDVKSYQKDKRILQYKINVLITAINQTEHLTPNQKMKFKERLNVIPTFDGPESRDENLLGALSIQEDFKTNENNLVYQEILKVVAFTTILKDEYASHKEYAHGMFCALI